MKELTLEQRDLLALATFLALTVWCLPDTLGGWLLFSFTADPLQLIRDYPWAPQYVSYLTGIFFGLLLVAPTPRRHGLRIGSIRQAWVPVLGACLLVVAAWWLVVAAFGLSLFPRSTAAIWLLSPLAQDLVFVGFLYTRFDEAFSGDVSPRLPIRRAVLLASVFFGLYHVPNVVTGGIVWLALLPITMLFFICQALMRQWTGSLLYATVAHSGVNFVSWWYSR
jgi:membrane protease YdiL (CAAX protease family)